MITIRPQDTGKDLEAIAALNAAAFADHGGTQAFDKFRAERDDIISLVAEENGKLLGHVLFSPAILDTPNGEVTGMGLGQLAVTPERQNQGIGTLLSQTGIAKLRSTRCPFVIVIGHAAYYPRFGFVRGSLHNVKCQWPNIPDETFMVLFLDEQSQRRLTGIASFDGL